jgi:hypothetical protein
MRPRIDDTSIKVLLAELPEFEECYLDLVEIYDEDLTPQVVFSELAEMVSNLVDAGDEDEMLDRCLEAVEAVANTPGVDLAETIGFSFLDGLRSRALDMVLERLGPATERALELLDADQLELSDAPLSAEDIADMLELEDRGFLAPGTTRAVATEAHAGGHLAPGAMEVLPAEGPVPAG